MQGLRIGHYTNKKEHTGASIFLFEEPAKAAYWQCGSSPASHELGVLELDAHVTHINGLLLVGGSAHGLASVEGMMRWLGEKKQGWLTPHGVVPIVPTAAIYDMTVGNAAYPLSDDVYQACISAVGAQPSSGQVGAGTGASVGKLIAEASPMTGGIGHASIKLASDVTVLAYAVVNCVGDVYDKARNIVAGAQFENGEFANCQKSLVEGYDQEPLSPNTTLVAIFTDADFSKSELRRIAKMATAGMALAIAPVFTRYDGDLIFAVSKGNKKASEMIIGAVAVELVHEAILNAVKHSVVLNKDD